MKTRRLDYTFEELLSMLSLSLLFGAKGLGFYDGQKCFLFLIYISFALLMLRFIGEQFTLSELICYIFCGMVLLINYKMSNDKGLIICFVIVLLTKNMDIKRLCKVGALAFGISGIVNIFLSFLGIRTGLVVLHRKLGGEMLRYAIGQPHPNVAHMTYFVFYCLLIMTIQKEENKFQRYNIVLFLGNVILFLFTVSYTGVLCCTILFVLLWIDCWEKDVNWFDWICAYGTLGMTVCISVVIPALLNLEGDRFYRLNQIINNRLMLLNRYTAEYTLKLWGQNLNNYDKVNYQLDNSWLTLYLGGGGVIFVMVLLFYIVGIYLLLKNNRKTEIYIIICTLIGGMTDPLLFNTSIKNIGLLFLGDVIYNELKEKETRKVCFAPKLNAMLERKRQIRICQLPILGRTSVWKGIIVALLTFMLMIASLRTENYTKYIVASMDYLGADVYVEPVYVTPEYLNDSSIRIFNYKDSDQLMWLIDTDRIRKIEWIRKVIGNVVVFSMLGYGGVIIWETGVKLAKKEKLQS